MDEVKEAEKHGWVDADKWAEQGKDPSDHITAARFNARGDFIGELKKNQNEMSGLRDDIASMKNSFATENKKSYERGLSEVQARHKEAVESGDTEAAAAAFNDAQQLQAPAPDNTLDQWKASNPWMVSDFDMAKTAMEADNFFAQGETPTDMIGHLTKVAQLVREKHPEADFIVKDGVGRVVETTRASLSEGSGRTIAKPSAKQENGFDQMDENAQESCRTVVAQGIMSEKDYVNSYFTNSLEM